MSEPVLDPSYWKGRLQSAGPIHHSIMKMPTDKWERIEARHRAILARTIGNRESVFDAGCGYGRLLTLMPVSWTGKYWGVDLSPDFVAMADQRHPGQVFSVCDLTVLPDDKLPLSPEFDWGVMVSVRPMIQRNCGDEVWVRFHRVVKAFSRRQLYLEYDEQSEGEIQ